MKIKKFSPLEAVRFGWGRIKGHLGFFFIVMLLKGLVDRSPDLVEKLVPRVDKAPFLPNEMFIVPSNLLTFFLLNLHIALFIVGTLTRMGMLKIGLKIHDREEVRVRDLFSCYPILFRFFSGTFLYLLIVAGGLLLLVVPGIIWAIRYGLYGFIIVDQGVGPIEALKLSKKMTGGSVFDLFLFGLLLIGVLILGFLCLGVGIFAAYPTALVAAAFVYRRLNSHATAFSEAEIPALSDFEPAGAYSGENMSNLEKIA